ncbi:MAG: stage III sporulation protein AB [Eubacterium sp.]|nr:stage III sporulation protein AB [Eubacterium sp.]
MIMITLFSSCLGLMAAKSKRKQIEYTDGLVYLGSRILLLLKSTMPETEEIIKLLKSDERLDFFDFSLDLKNSPLSQQDNQKILNLFNSLGMYDIDSQIMIVDEFTGYFKMLNQQYQNYYDKHYKLYIIFGISSGLLLSVILM